MSHIKFNPPRSREGLRFAEVIEIKTERMVFEMVAQLIHRKTVFSYSLLRFFDFLQKNYLTLQKDYRCSI